MFDSLKLSLLGLACAGAIGVVACGPAPTDEAIATQTDEISTRTNAYVSVRRDTRRCRAPLCGGYWVKDVNRSTAEVYVSRLDLSAFDAATIADIEGADVRDLVLYGHLGSKDRGYDTRPMIVLDAYRGLPGFTRRSSDLFYSVTANDPPIECFAAPCNNDVAQRLNSTAAPRAFTGVSVASVLASLVDGDWVVGRVERHGALVAGHFANGQTFPAGRESLLVASQVYVHLPDSTGPCPMPPIRQCPAGLVNVFSRTADRCLIPAGCVPQGVCPQYMPACDQGYTLDGWSAAPNGCEAFACDPSFILP